MVNTALFEHLQAQEELKQLLAKYANICAIFDGRAADDSDEKWDGERYPRIVYTADMTADSEKGNSGSLKMNILCESGKQGPEDIEAVLRGCVDGYFFAGETKTISAVWHASHYFKEENGTVSGVSLSFLLYAFPKQVSGGPDPVGLMNAYGKQCFPGVFVIEDDALPNASKPTDDNPFIYWRLVNLSPCSYINDTWSCMWQTATMHLHIFSKSKDMELSRKICRELMASHRLVYPDGDGQLLIDSVRITPGNNAHSMGQVTLEASFGTLREEEQKTKLEYIKYSKGF